MAWRSFLYAIPLIPFVPRALMVTMFRSATSDLLPETAAKREQHRSFILVLAGFSFTGLLGLAVAPLAVAEIHERQRLQGDLQLPTYFLLTSFLFYIFALNLQGYKKRWRHDLLGDALIDAAALSLLSSIVVIVWDASNNLRFTVLIGVFAVSIWLTDQIVRERLTWKIFREKEKQKKGQLKMLKDDSALPGDGGVGNEPSQPAPSYAPALTRIPAASVPHNAPHVSFELSALDFITCTKCQATYLEGDEHKCP